MLFAFADKQLTVGEFLQRALNHSEVPKGDAIVLELPVSTMGCNISSREAIEIACRTWLGVSPKGTESVSQYLERVEEDWLGRAQGRTRGEVRPFRPSKSA